jgi:hypothetical protein
MPGISLTDLITGVISFLFTLLILSYVIGDNPAFRAAVHAFVGVSAGYIVISVFRLVILDKLFLPLVNGVLSGALGQVALLVIPLLAALMLLGKLSPSSEWLGRPIVAFLVGVGTAAAVGGAIMGTILPQILSLARGGLFDTRSAAGNVGGLALNVVTGVAALVGTLATLAFFQFTVLGKNRTSGKRGGFMKILALVGQIFIVITLGTIFAGVLAASLTAFVDRVQSVIELIAALIF